MERYYMIMSMIQRDLLRAHFSLADMPRSTTCVACCILFTMKDLNMNAWKTLGTPYLLPIAHLKIMTPN